MLGVSSLLRAGRGCGVIEVLTLCWNCELTVITAL